MAKTKAFEFTKEELEQLPSAAPGKRDMHRDTRMSRLYLRVTDRGVKTFYHVRKVDGRVEWSRLGLFPETPVGVARKLAETENAKFTRGENPAEERRVEREERRTALTFGELWDKYKAAYQAGNTRGGGRSIGTLESQWNVWLSRWKSERLETITDSMVEAWRDEIRKIRSAAMANKMLVHGRAMYAFAAKSRQIKYAGPNPFAVVDKLPERKPRKERLKKAQIAALFAALERISPTMKDLFLTCLFTGVRAGNVKAMRWDELDLVAGVWTIPRTKSGESHEASLAKPVVALLKARRPEDTDENPWVFPSDSESGHVVTYRKAWMKACGEAGISNLRVHDLRRTLSSWAAEAKVNVAVVQAQLGHLDPQTTLKHYTSIAGPERKRAVDSTVAAMMKAAIAGTKH